MIFIHDKDVLKIKLSFKERVKFIFKGYIKFNRKSSFGFYNHLMYLITEGMRKYGDAREHGTNVDGDQINSK